MADFIPNICGDSNIYIPQEGCDDCTIFEERLEIVEQTNIEQDERLDALEECCEEARTTLANHDDAINQHTASIETINNRFDDYYTKAETYSQAQVDSLISQIEVGGYEEVSELPAVGEPNVIYLVPKQGGGYERWIYSNGEWKDLGGTDIDLSGYVRVDEVIDMIHPVGDTIIRMDNIDPSTLYTGTTWQKISEGRMLIGADASYPLGSTGGSANAVVVSHNHTQNAHNHSQNAHNHPPTYSGVKFLVSGADIVVASTARRPPTQSGGEYYIYSQSPGSSNGIDEIATTGNATATNNATTATNNATGESGTGKNMPPYLAVNIWVRTA